MSVELILSLYFTFSILVAFYAFSYFRKRQDSVAFALFGAFILIFTWWIPAAKLIKNKLTYKKSV